MAYTNHKGIAVTYFKGTISGFTGLNMGKQQVALVRIFGAPSEIPEQRLHPYRHVILVVGFKMEYLIWNAG
jgi:cytochrome b subunit of formate dehydrogenase